MQIQLSNAEPETYAARTARVLGSQLQTCQWNDNNPDNFRRLEALLEGLGALGGMTYCPKSIKPAMAAVAQKLKQVSQLASDSDEIEIM